MAQECFKRKLTAIFSADVAGYSQAKFFLYFLRRLTS